MPSSRAKRLAELLRGDAVPRNRPRAAPSDDILAELLRSAPGWFDPPSGEARGIYDADLRRVVERHGFDWDEAQPGIERLVERSGGSHRRETFVATRRVSDALLARAPRTDQTIYYELPRAFFRRYE